MGKKDFNFSGSRGTYGSLRIALGNPKDEATSWPLTPATPSLLFSSIHRLINKNPGKLW